ncbi:MAG: sugar ABC transporter substrate-binding protein [Chloroflexi bacterium]|nr:MAG: sugar ABC transporter substrate-binding protein [Phototrophicales bacterium]RMF78939.1 MAG: sugar ABC transporter substrate-binding protein [Chloroflexota bacterium]
MLKKFSILGVIVLVLLALSVSLVGAQDEITLRWRTRPDNQAEIDVYQAASDAIDAAMDGVTLVYEPGGSETSSYQDVLITELTAGTAPDVFWIPGTDIARFAELGVILNLADFAAADEDFNADDFYSLPMRHLTTALEEGVDTLWGLPRDVSSFAIYYNADLFAEAGIPTPNEVENWDWEAFREAAEAINDLGDEIKGYGQNAWWGPWGVWVNGAGSSFFNEDFTACGLNNDATVVGLEFAAGLYADDLAVPWGEDSEPPFLAGNVGMFQNGRWAVPGVAANADFEWDVAPLPEGPANNGNWLFWGAYVVNADTENPEAAWNLVRELTSAEIQGQIANLGANIPSRSTPEAQELFLNTVPELGINNQAFLDGALGAPAAEAPLFFGDWPAIDAEYGAQVSRVLNGELSAQEFADTICDRVAGSFE